MENGDFLFLSKILQKVESQHKNLIRNYFYGIYDRDTYYILMKKLKSISDDLINSNIKEYFTEKHNMSIKKLNNLSYDIGYNSIYDIIEFNYSEWFRYNISTLTEYSDINFYNTNFNCLSYKIINNTHKEFNLLLELNKKIILKNDNSIRYKKSLIERLNSAELIIYIKKSDIDSEVIDEEFLSIYGYFDNNNLSLQNNILEEKIKEINKQLTEKFHYNYLKIFNYRDLILYDINKIIENIRNIYNDYTIFRAKSNSLIIKEFLISSSIKQREILTNLICSDIEDNIVLANSLFETLTKNTDLTKFNNNSADELFKSLHFTIQEKLKDAFKAFENIKKKLTSDYDIDLPYDKKIILLNCSDSIKKKAFAKIKELDGSRELSTKAQLYLDGFLKIPFGTYIKEPIFTIKDEFLVKINKNNKSNKLLYDSEIENFLNSSNNSELKEEWATFVKNKTEYLLEVDNILNEAVYGHHKTKQALKRLIGQWINGKLEGNVIGLCGPPGVGKTSFAKRGLSRCLHDDKGTPRPFAFLPIGGATNGSFLEGHGYTYMGSTWGKIADILMETKCMNPIIFIDELDKISNTEHGREIIGILTHITDPTQNGEFHDKFFQGVPLDLSKVLFVFSYNDRSLVDRILRDRIHEIIIKPLTKEEKIHITKYYTLPELYNNIGFSNTDIIWDQYIIEYLIETYTLEAGIRKLNELLNEILREVNLERIKDSSILPKNINLDFINELFYDKPKIKPLVIHDRPKVGVINGLYASAIGLGGLTPIEVFKNLSETKLSLELTGSQGDVMKESMKVAKTLAWHIIPDNIKKLIKEEMELIGNFGLHIHCPDGATPKDGPSAGGAITIAIISRLCNVRIRNDLCITGEINLTGNFTAIGGLDAKLKGGEKAGCKIAIIPKENENDYLNIIRDYKLNLEVLLLDNILDVLKYALLEEDLIKYNITFNSI